ncbi:MAG: hypothetical protein V4732_07040 [Pseudomonadota bacterium]
MNMPLQYRRSQRAIRLISGYLLLMSCHFASASPEEHGSPKSCKGIIAPQTIVGMQINMHIENTVTTYTTGVPTEGVTVKHYKKEGAWTAEGTGGLNQQNYFGTYKYQRTGTNTAIEKGIDTSLHNTPYITKYTFETADRGKWEEDWGNGQIIFSGSFTMIPGNLANEHHTAPATITGLNIALVIKDASSAQLPDDVYPKRGLALQTYAQDGTFTIKGFGPKTLNSTGTYTYKKVSANTAVEEAIQVTDLFTLPYTMVYTFDTPSSGTWFQNLGNGFIKFRGTFETFPN